jgi:hypothetical protein
MYGCGKSWAWYASDVVMFAVSQIRRTRRRPDTSEKNTNPVKPNWALKSALKLHCKIHVEMHTDGATPWEEDGKVAVGKHRTG